MPIIWKEEMSIGHELIDNEHKYLFCLVNSVELALKLEDSQQLVAMFLDQLQEYTQKHFLHEESLLIDWDYPGYAEHKNEHQKILNNVSRLKSQLSQADSKNSQKKHQAAAKKPVLETACEVEDYDPYAVETLEQQPKPQPEQSADAIVKLLRFWILDHVLVEDMKIKKHIKQPA